ncbi:MAG: hypothetical protein AB1540_07455 [Bdellovibrionota bacterium]
MIQEIAQNRVKRRKRGQALIEYVVATVVIVGVFFAIDFQIRRSIGRLWKALAQDVAAGCPGCESPASIR